MESVSIRSLHLHLCLVAILVALALYPNAVKADGEASRVDQLIAQIRSEPSAQVRHSDAHELFLLLKDLDERGEVHTISERMIDELAALLADDAVALSVVASAGFLGPRAVRLVPALQAAHARNCARLKARNCTILGFDSTSAIAAALKRITGQPPTCCLELDAS